MAPRPVHATDPSQRSDPGVGGLSDEPLCSGIWPVLQKGADLLGNGDAGDLFLGRLAKSMEEGILLF